jgi:hypothetical protein
MRQVCTALKEEHQNASTGGWVQNGHDKKCMAGKMTTPVSWVHATQTHRHVKCRSCPRQDCAAMTAAPMPLVAAITGYEIGMVKKNALVK